MAAKRIEHILMTLLIIIASVLFGVINSAPAPREPCTAGLRVHLTVSPLVNGSVRQLEVHWSGAEPQDGDWVGLFQEDPAGASPLPPDLTRVDPGVSCSGWQRTDVTEENRVNNSVDLGFEPRCVGYYAGYVRNSTVLASTCLRLEPTWMSERPDLGLFPLTDVFLPGSHDSGAYGEFDPDMGETQVTKYTVTQDEDVLSQLIRGVRYLDIRIGYYRQKFPFPWRPFCWRCSFNKFRNENASGFWLNHGAFRMRPMEEVTSQVRTFLANTPDTEIVIFDVQEFTTGFNSPSEHEKLVAFFASEFEGYFIPGDQTRGWTTPLSDLWSTKKRLIVSYDDTAMTTEHPWLWQSVKHMWGDVRFVEDLYTYLADVQVNHPTTRAWSAMAELTPNTWDVITDVFGGLRHMADSVNRNVTTWYLGSWGRTVNTVAVDFFRGSDIVRTALEWNDRRVARKGGRCADDWEMTR